MHPDSCPSSATSFSESILNREERRDVSATLVRRAESLGFKEVVLTVDTPDLGRREADIRNKMIAPMSPNPEGLMSFDDDLDAEEGGSKLERWACETLDPSSSWKDVEWLKSVTRLPILPKGILTAEDARKAVEAGAAGVIVSNHGARQLDYAPAVLEEVVKAVVGGVPVLVDGGVRRGTDVALALGATAVMVKQQLQVTGMEPWQIWTRMSARVCRWGDRCSTGWRRAVRPGRGT